MVKTRFAPSPTGYLHVGNIRIAFLNYLYSMQNNGIFFLRFENTDLVRSFMFNVYNSFKDINWIGINYNYVSYYQTVRFSYYKFFYKFLKKEKKVYYCFCSDLELLKMKEQQLFLGVVPKYDGTCKKLKDIDIYQKFLFGFKPVLRFNVPINKIIRFYDILKGEQECNSNSIGDFVVRKSNLFPSFIFSNLIDDLCMSISHVFRGEDHVTNTFKQILIAEAIDFSKINYGHIPMLNSLSGQVLSKRDGGFSLQKLKKQGFSSLSIVNYLCKINKENNVFLSLKELSNFFDYEKIVTRASKYDIFQLKFFQKQYILKNINYYKILVFPYGNGYFSIKCFNYFKRLFSDSVFLINDIIKWIKIFCHKDINYQKVNLSYLCLYDRLFCYELFFILNIISVDHFFYLKNNMVLFYFNSKKFFTLIRLIYTDSFDGPKLNDIFIFLDIKFLIFRLNKFCLFMDLYV